MAVLALAFAISPLVLMSDPSSLFEWDEVVFARALNRYDPAANSPHMPGYPAFVGLCRVTSILVADPVRAVQATSAVSALGCAVLLFCWLRRSSLPAAGWVASAVVVCCPAFFWYASVGLSDAAGALAVAATIAAVLREDPRLHWAAAAGVLAAVAVGVRTQSVYLLMPLAVVGLVMWRNRRIARVGVALAAGAVSSLAIWLPAILVTGPSRWWSAFRWQLEWVAKERQAGLALPHAAVGDVARGWLLDPFGAWWLAALFWSLVVIGAWGFVRGGRRQLGWALAFVGAVSMATAAFSLDYRNGPRYFVCFLPVFGVAAGGLVHLPPWRRRVGVSALVLFAAGSAVWLAPGVALRRSEPSPVIAVLQAVAEGRDPATTVVFHEARILPHAEWVLGRAGFEVHPIEAYSSWAAREGEQRTAVLIRSLNRPPPAGALVTRQWTSPQVATMTPGRYMLCWLEQP